MEGHGGSFLSAMEARLPFESLTFGPMQVCFKFKYFICKSNLFVHS